MVTVSGNKVCVCYHLCIRHTLDMVLELHQSSENTHCYFHFIKNNQRTNGPVNAHLISGPTLLTPSFGNHLFANYHVHKHPLTNLILSSFYIPKVLRSAAKIPEICSQIKIQRPKIIWIRAFSIVKMLPREVTIFLEKKKNTNFLF